MKFQVQSCFRPCKAEESEIMWRCETQSPWRQGFYCPAENLLATLAFIEAFLVHRVGKDDFKGGLPPAARCGMRVVASVAGFACMGSTLRDSFFSCWLSWCMRSFSACVMSLTSSLGWSRLSWRWQWRRRRRATQHWWVSSRPIGRGTCALISKWVQMGQQGAFFEEIHGACGTKWIWWDTMKTNKVNSCRGRSLVAASYVLRSGWSLLHCWLSWSLCAKCWLRRWRLSNLLEQLFLQRYSVSSRNCSMQRIRRRAACYDIDFKSMSVQRSEFFPILSDDK